MEFNNRTPPLFSLVFANDNTLDYCAQLEYKQSYAALSPLEQAAVDILARERFMAFGLLKTAGSSHDKIKSDLSDEFTKGSDNYPITPQQTLLLLEKYSKKPTLVTPSRVLLFPRKERRVMERSLVVTSLNLISNSTRTRSASAAARRDTLRQRAQ